MRIFELANDYVFTHIARMEFEAAHVRLRESLTCARQIDTPHFLAKTLAAGIAVWHSCGEQEQPALWAAA